MFERFTEKTQRTIFFARYEASQFGSLEIGTEHLLLGLMREDKSLTNRFLRSHSSIESIKKEIEGLTIIREKVSTSIDMPLSAECKRILAYSAEEAERLHHRHIGTEHLFLGILREEGCLAAQVLRENGVRLELAREALVEKCQESGHQSLEQEMFLEHDTGGPLRGSSDPFLPREVMPEVAPGDREAVMIVSELTKTYPSAAGPLEILRGIDLTVYRGEMIAIVGQSGSGKSTLLHILGTIDRPSSGTVRFGDQDPFALRPERLARFRRQSVGFVFQFHNLLPEFTALENVMMPRLISGNHSDDKRGVELLNLVGLGDRLRHRPGELSGGEQQRVAIARALVNDPLLILADEPTGALDNQTGEKVFQLFQKIQREKKLTSILATHNVNIANRCNRLFRLENGRLQGINQGYV
jgi:lipoprotein-releasing system ATP-binding protein